MSGWKVVVGGSRAARERWPTKTYKTKAAAKRRVKHIHDARDLGVSSIWLVHADAPASSYPADSRRAHHGNAARSRLDHLLDRVKPGQHEVTIDVEALSPAQIDQVIATARARGLHVSGTRRWLLIRDLRPRHGNALTRRGYLREFKVSKIHLDRGGYDRHGRYYGVGQGLYRVSSEDGDVIVRADSAREARAEALRRPGYWGGWR